MSTPLAILNTGLVTAIGLSAPATCAALRAGVRNPSETRFIDIEGKWIVAHQVPLDAPWRGLTKLAKMAAMAIAEALQSVRTEDWKQLPLILCVAEAERPGRATRLDEDLFARVQSELGVTFAAQSAIVAQGRIGVAAALMHARSLIDSGMPQVIVAAADSLLSWRTLSYYQQRDRLLTATNSDGFMPGEAAGALLVGASTGQLGELACTGIGFGREPAHIDSEEPLRADGLSHAVKAAMADAGCQLHEMDFRITDISGEQYYFKEAALTLSRTLRVLKPEFDLWHPAECTGEVGAASGVTIIAAARAACMKQYAKGPNVLAHMANDAGQRAALALQYRTAA